MTKSQKGTHNFSNEFEKYITKVKIKKKILDSMIMFTIFCKILQG